MPASASDERFRLQPWQQVAGSILILLHLAAVALGGFLMLSGPWPTPPMGEAIPYDPPRFAMAGSQISGPVYNDGLRIAVHSRYATNRPAQQIEVQFKVILRDAKGDVLQTITFPDEKANPWVRHRQAILAQWLNNDGMMQPLEGEILPASGKQQQRRSVWRELAPQSFQGSRWHLKLASQKSEQSYEFKQLNGLYTYYLEWKAAEIARKTNKPPIKIVSPNPAEGDPFLTQVLEQWQKENFSQEVSENNVDWEPLEMLIHVFTFSQSQQKWWLVHRDVNTLPRQSPFRQPGEASMLALKSYVRYLRKLYGADSVEVIRTSQVAYPPMVLVMPDNQQPQPALFGKVEFYFGKVTP